MASPAQQDGPLDRLCGHIVSLLWSDELISPVSDPSSGATDRKPEAFAVSAFVIAVRDIWFLVTAGHVLHKLDQRLEKYGRRIVNSHLIDGLAGGLDHLPAIPFPLGSTSKWYVDSDDGNDYGLIPLSPLFAAQLQAGGIRPLSEKAWTDIPESADSYYLVGFPTQAKRVRVNQKGVSVELRTPLLPIEPTSTPPESLRCDTERFYANVPVGVATVVGGETITLTDIDGMSGGPIFAFKERDDGYSRYWVIAVQSSWDRQARVLAGFLIQPLLNAIGAIYDRCDADLGSVQDGA